MSRDGQLPMMDPRESARATAHAPSLWTRPRTFLVLVGIGVLLTILLVSGANYHAPPNPAPPAPRAVPAASLPGYQASATYPSSSAAAALTLGTTASPAQICQLGLSSCNAGTGTTRVTLSAAATAPPQLWWPDVQVAFVIETTAYDGDFDHYNSYYGHDACAEASSGQGPLCEESNGVPFFIANAGTIARAIAEQNPHSNVSFAMVDFFGTDYDWNDGPGDSWKYHVDIADFVPAENFGSSVIETFQAEQMNEANGWGCICGLDDNFLHSSSITALYGTIIGSGLTWSLNTHHVIVLLGSTAPRDPNYPINYWVSGFDTCCAGSSEYSGTCEPSYQFENGASPNCEGWVRSQDGNPDHSIAALTKSSPTCTDSIGHTCTIDVIDYWDTPTDPFSQGWPSGSQDQYPVSKSLVGPGAPGPVADASNILLAGCDLAAATGGTWNGPSYWTCPNGVSGSLQYVQHGAMDNPNTVNPTLFNAIRQIGFGPVYRNEVANTSGQPMFTYVPPGNFKLANPAAFSAACSTPSGFFPTCQTTPTVLSRYGVLYLGWNWSTNKSQDAIFVGDSWTASFNIVNSGPPYSLDPVLACTTVACRAAGAGPINGLYSAMTYQLANSTAVTIQSFPLAQVDVLSNPPIGPPPITPPPLPPIPPAAPIVVGTPASIPLLTPTAVGQGIANISLQATAAGFLGAGFMRVSLKNRPIAMKVAAKSGVQQSKFEKEQSHKESHIGKFE
jgi:hypothetical protein